MDRAARLLRGTLRETGREGAVHANAGDQHRRNRSTSATQRAMI